MSRWFVIILIIIFVLAAGLAVFLQTTWPLERILTASIVRAFRQAQLHHVSILNYRFKGSKGVILEQITIDLDVEGVNYLLRIDEAVIQDWTTFPRNFASELVVKGVHLASEDLRISNAWVKVRYDPDRQKKAWSAAGYAAAPHVSYRRIGMQSIEATFQASPDIFRMKEWRGKILEGAVNGEFLLEYGADLPYHMDIIFSGINTAMLPAEFDFRGHLEAVLDGTLTIRGDARHIDLLEGELGAPAGARASAALLRAFTFFTRQIDQPHMKIVDQAISRQNRHFLEVFSLSWVNKGTEEISSTIVFKSKSSNLDFTATYDIKMGMDLMSLVRSGEQYLQLYKQYLEHN